MEVTINNICNQLTVASEKRGRGGRRRREREEEGRRITMLTAEPQVHGSHLASLSCPEGGVVIAIR